MTYSAKINLRVAFQSVLFPAAKMVLNLPWSLVFFDSVTINSQILDYRYLFF